MPSWARRLFKVENIALLVAFIASFVVVILELFGQFASNQIPTVILFCLSILIIGLLVERIVYFDRIEKAITKLGNGIDGIFGVYLSRNDLPPYKDYVKNATEQVIVISIDLGETSTRYMDYLAEIAERHIHVRLLAFDPDSQCIQLPAKLRDMQEDELRTRIKASLERIERYCSRLSESQRSYFELRVYDWAPTWGGVSVDPGNSSGKLLVDVFQYGAIQGIWPEIELRPNIGSGEFYSFYAKRYIQAWNDAKPWPKS